MIIIFYNVKIQIRRVLATRRKTPYILLPLPCHTTAHLTPKTPPFHTPNATTSTHNAPAQHLGHRKPLYASLSP